MSASAIPLRGHKFTPFSSTTSAMQPSGHERHQLTSDKKDRSMLSTGGRPRSEIKRTSKRKRIKRVLRWFVPQGGGEQKAKGRPSQKAKVNGPHGHGIYNISEYPQDQPIQTLQPDHLKGFQDLRPVAQQHLQVTNRSVTSSHFGSVCSILHHPGQVCGLNSLVLIYLSIFENHGQHSSTPEQSLQLHRHHLHLMFSFQTLRSVGECQWWRDQHIHHSQGCHEHNLSRSGRCRESNHWSGCSSSNGVQIRLFQCGISEKQIFSNMVEEQYFTTSSVTIIHQGWLFKVPQRFTSGMNGRILSTHSLIHNQQIRSLQRSTSKSTQNLGYGPQQKKTKMFTSRSSASSMSQSNRFTQCNRKEAHSLTHMPFRPLCPVCQRATGQQHYHKGRSQKIQSVIQLDHSFYEIPGENETLKVLTFAETVTSMSEAVIVPDLSVNQVAVKALKQLVAVNNFTKSVLQCDCHSGLLSHQEQVARDCSLPTQVSPPCSHQSQGTIERFRKTLYGEVRAISIGLADHLGIRSDQVEGSFMRWITQHAAYQINRYLVRSDERHPLFTSASVFLLTSSHNPLLRNCRFALHLKYHMRCVWERTSSLERASSAFQVARSSRLALSLRIGAQAAQDCNSRVICGL